MNFILSDKIRKYYITDTERYYYMGKKEKFVRYFFPESIMDMEVELHIYDIQLHDNAELDGNNINVMLCVENCAYHKHYKHHTKYGDFGDDKIRIYFYNHIDKCIITDKYIAIPVIHSQMRYLKNYYDIIAPTIYTPFEHRHFCLFATSPSIPVKLKIMEQISRLGECHDIASYVNEIGNKSCYHSIELLNVFNRYKFVFVCENSVADGYITEKIFNCLFARTIPIYYGSSNIRRYINRRAFIEVNIDNIHEMANQIQGATERMILEPKISETYDDENYDIKLKAFIEHCNY